MHAEPVGEDSLAILVRTVSDALRGGNSASSECVHASRELARILFSAAPNDDSVHGCDLLPDGPLHRLPFEVLPFGTTTVIDHGEVAYASSATLLAERRRQQDPADLVMRDDDREACPLLAFGDPTLTTESATDPASAQPAQQRGGLPHLTPLPYARREVRHLQSLIPGACVLVGAEANEAAFAREAPHSRLLHLATHAWIDDENPEYSGIALAPTAASATAKGEDGLLQAWEVAQMNLQADLVTLSACETGRGRWLRGEGIVGLARAFRIAGARSLVVSLWDVDDAATAELMRLFYERLVEGEPACTALRGAKLAFRASAAKGMGAGATAARGVQSRRRTDFANTDAWAAFVLLGDVSAFGALNSERAVSPTTR